jgi:hypothetical protein
MTDTSPINGTTVRRLATQMNPCPVTMLIRYGYKITVTCAQPTAMVCLMSVSEDRKTDIRVFATHLRRRTSHRNLRRTAEAR